MRSHEFEQRRLKGEKSLLEMSRLDHLRNTLVAEILSPLERPGYIHIRRARFLWGLFEHVEKFCSKGGSGLNCTVAALSCDGIELWMFSCRPYQQMIQKPTLCTASPMVVILPKCHFLQTYSGSGVKMADMLLL